LREYKAVEALNRVLEDSPQEYGEFLLSAVPSPPDKRDVSYRYIAAVAAGFRANVPVPSAVDYRPNLGEVFDQGRRGSCVCCAIARTDKEYEEISQGDCPVGGLSPAMLYALCKQNDGVPEKEGTYPRVAYKMLRKYGVCPESEFPYSSLTELPAPKVPDVPEHCFVSAGKYSIASYTRLAGPADSKAEREPAVGLMRQAIAHDGPITCAVLVTESFIEGVKPPHYVVPKPKGRILGGHMVALAGYDDAKRAFILRNSWGKKWGDNGYAYLPYDYVTGRFDYGWYMYETWTGTDVVIPLPAGRIEIFPDEHHMRVDGTAVTLDQPARITVNNRLMLPVRAMAGNMGYYVEWNERERKAILTLPSKIGR